MDLEFSAVDLLVAGPVEDTNLVVATNRVLPLATVAQRLVAHREELVGWLQTALQDTLFSNRSFIRPSHLKQIPAAEADTFLAFLKNGDINAARAHGMKRAAEGLGDEALLRVGATLRRFCLAHLQGELLETSLAAADLYIEPFLQAFYKTREAIVLAEQERIRAALQRALSRYTLQLETAAEIAQAASSILDLDELVTASVNLICERFDLDYAGIFLLDECGEWAALSAFAGETGRETLRLGDKLKVGGESAIGWCAAHARARVLLNVSEELARYQQSLLPEARSEMALPLISRGRVIGAMSLQSSRVAAFSDEDSTTLRPMTNLLANAIENARLYAAAQQEIAERVRAEAALAQLAQELARSNAELEQFAYAASHDLQEPLRMVSSFVQLLAQRYQGVLDADADEFIEFAVDGASRMQRLINDLLAFSRVGTRGKEFEPTNCGAIFKIVLTNLQVAIAESAAVVTHNPLPVVMADGSQLVQLFQNLITNAIRFRGDDSPVIHIGADWVDGGSQGEAAHWVFAVRDNGLGIDPEYAERIFVIFQRLHIREEYPGTGIGLAICKKIVERHGGRIWVESEPGKGATFCFTLPKAQVR